jgi:predicted AAA+ superfamily ATPase
MVPKDRRQICGEQLRKAGRVRCPPLSLTMRSLAGTPSPSPGELFWTYHLLLIESAAVSPFWGRGCPDSSRLYYWRTASDQEVDIVLEDSAGRLVGVEVKASATLSASDVRSLEAFSRAVGTRWIRGIVLYTGAEVVPFARNLHGIPLPFLWLAR